MNMKRSQKILALLLIFMLFASVLSACGQKTSSGSQGWATPKISGSSDSGDKADVDDDGVYDGPDDSEDGLAPAAPGFTGTEKAELIAPYHALAIEYNGYIYYLDHKTNLCRADTNMQNYELVLAQPLGEEIDTAYLCGVTNAGMIYIGSAKGSCYLDANSADLWPLLTTTFSGDVNQVRIFGISGGWMYYTKDRDTDKFLYRCKLGGAFYTEEKVFDFEISDAALTEDYIVLVCDEFMTLGYQCLDGLQREGMNKIDSVSKYRTGLSLMAVADALVAYNLTDDPFVLGSKLRTINLRDGITHSGTNILGLRGYDYDTENDELFYFYKQLAHRPVQEIEDDASYSNPKGYKTDDYLMSSGGATIAGDWFFFKGNVNVTAPISGGADYFIDLDGITLTKLD